MDSIPGDNHQIERNREDRAQERKGSDGNLNLSSTAPICCHCSRPLVPGIRYSWEKGARQACGACSKPNAELLTFQ